MGDTIGKSHCQHACYKGRGSVWRPAAVDKGADNRPDIRIICDSVAQLLYSFTD
jgi:hypothetical protein